MSESFVDLTYRGLALGRRVKLTQVRPSTGYLEIPAPMPVGTAIAIATDDGVQTAAIVAAVHEQVGGSDRAPGMLVTPALDTEAARAWWSARVTLPELVAAPAAAPAGGMVLPKRPAAVPELVDDGVHTAAMDAIATPADDGGGSAGSAGSDDARLVDDGKRTTAMDAVDLEALGLGTSASSAGSPAGPTGDDDDESPAGDAPDSKPGGGSVQRRKRKRR